MELWTRERSNSVVAWKQSMCATDATITAPDVITSATLDQPSQHTATWDTRDFRGGFVPDGDYVLWLQVTENEIFPEGPFMKIAFRKGIDPFTMAPPAETGFKDIAISYAPLENASD
jgi:hypothetical protein